MPHLTIKIPKISIEKKRLMVREITDTILKYTNVRPEDITIELAHPDLENVAVGGVLRSDI